MKTLMHTLIWLFGSQLLLISAYAAGMVTPIDTYRVEHTLHDNLTILAYHDVREDIRSDFAADQFAVSAGNLTMQFSWLRDNDYTVVSIDEVLGALKGKRPLPKKAVLLSFDDGLETVYTAVYPLLQLFDYPALVSVVTSWIETDAVEVKYENHVLSSGDFLKWSQIKEMQRSGLIEIGSHTHNMHQGVPGNPQKNMLPAAVTRTYDDSYATHDQYLARVEADLARSAQLIRKNTDLAPRVVVWPYGQYNADVRNIAAIHGMELSFSLDTTDTDLTGFPVIGRSLITENPGVEDFGLLFLDEPKPEVLRAAQVDMDYIYDPDPLQTEENLGVLLDRIKALGISHVFLQAFADPDADGAADALYFPNRHMPMRADLFSRVSWQLQTRCEVKVFAWMPLLGYTGEDINPDWLLLQDTGDDVAPDADAEPRLSIFVPEARQFIQDIYTDLAIYTNFDGIHFHDDGRLNEYEDANPAALAFYRQQLGDDFTIARAQEDGELAMQWAELKATALVDFSLELRDAVRIYRPVLRTSRNMFASALLEQGALLYLAQDFDEYLAAYDYVTIMAMPLLEGASSEKEFYAGLVREVSARPGALKRTVFQLQAVDWRDGFDPIPTEQLVAQMKSLQSQGVLNLAYYPDDFLQNHPQQDVLRSSMSLTDFPVVQ